MTVDTITVALGVRSYDIVVGAGLLSRLGQAVSGRFGSPKIFIVTDAAVAEFWLEPARASLSAAGYTCETIIMPAGESTKSFACLQQLLEAMLAAGVERDTVVVALGGGVIGDLAGFAAAIALRGLACVQVPTTLLAQVDSSVGGKTALNTRHGKNLVGAFHQPALVVIDTAVLDTLPQREILAGYAEMVKYGLIRRRGFFDWLESNGRAVIAGDAEARRIAIVESCRTKADIVAADEREAGERALLNFGHTFGHALEAEAGYAATLLHGEAVAIGMGLAFDLSQALGLCSGQDAVRARRHLAAMGLPRDIAAIPGARHWTVERLLGHMRRDKKVVGGRLRFVLTRGIGAGFVTDDVPEDAVAAVIEASRDAVAVAPPATPPATGPDKGSRVEPT